MERLPHGTGDDRTLDEGIVLTDEQSSALDEIVAWRRSSGGSFFALTGPAGSGKTSLVDRLLDRSTFILCATTGKAALRLAGCVRGHPTSTLHSALYFPPTPGRPLRFEKIKAAPSGSAVLVDEASMLTPQIYEDLGIWVSQNVKVLLVGDEFQLPPVVTDKRDKEKFGEDYSVFSHVKGPRLETVMRSAGGVLRAATVTRETQRICRESYPDERGGYEYVECESPMDRAIADWLEDQSDHALITWRNETRMHACRMIRDDLGYGGPLPDPGEPVLIKRNGQGYMNGEVVTCGGWETGPIIGENKKAGTPGLPTMWLQVEGAGKVLVSVTGSSEGDPEDPRFFDGAPAWVVDFAMYHMDLRNRELPEPTPVTFGYVLTCHASQGHEFRRATTFLDGWDVRSSNFNKMTTLPDGVTKVPFSARFAYTSTSRAKERSAMIVGY